MDVVSSLVNYQLQFVFIKSKEVFITQCLLIGIVSVSRLLEGVAGVS